MLLILTYRPFYTLGGSSANQLLYIHFSFPPVHQLLCMKDGGPFSLTELW